MVRGDGNYSSNEFNKCCTRWNQTVMNKMSLHLKKSHCWLLVPLLMGIKSATY